MNSDSLAPLLKGTNLYLIGLMGSGKSTVGQGLATRLGYRWLDTDTVVEQVAGRSIPELFSDVGEAAFRQLETQVLAGVAAHKNLVVSTGGGIVLARENWGLLRHGIVVWLDAPVELLYARLVADPAGLATRPLLQGSDPQGALQALLVERSPRYAQADVRIPLSAADSPAQIAEQVLVQVRSSLRPPYALPEN